MGIIKEKTRTRPDELTHFVVTTGTRIEVLPASGDTVVLAELPVEEETDAPVDAVKESEIEPVSDAASADGTTVAPAEEPAVVREPVNYLRNALAAVAYLNILFLVPLLASKGDDYVRSHLRQGMTLFALTVALSFVAWFSSIAWLVLAALLALASVACAVLAWRGRNVRLPLFGGIADKLAV